jgi:Calpain family cysteine protease
MCVWLVCRSSDDYFPCDPVTGQPAFTHCNGPELWVMLLEKAWAKVHGGYLSIEGGVSCDVLTAFTGAPRCVVLLYCCVASAEPRSPLGFPAFPRQSNVQDSAAFTFPPQCGPRNHLGSDVAC